MMFALGKKLLGLPLLLLCVASVQAVERDADPKATLEAATRPSRTSTEAIDEAIRKIWEESGIQTSQVEDDGVWARRVFLDVIGRPPSLEETKKWLSSKGKNRRAALVDRLLGEDYQEDYAEFWADVWTNWMIGRNVNGNDGVTQREGLWQFTFEAFKNNEPLDKFAYKLITASGSNRKGDPNYNGAVNFLSGKVQDGGIQATDRCSRLFLGVQVQCTQCHNHPFNKAKQNQFWEMNAFFRQARALRREVSEDERYIELVDEDFVDETGDADEAAVIYDLRNNKRMSAYPVFLEEQVAAPDRRPLASGRISVVNRRKAFADRLVQSDRFAAAQVNRLWGHFLGIGFTKPVDDMGPHNPPFAPELLDELASAFRYHGHDQKELIRSIVLSTPYQLSSQANRKNETDDLTLGNPPKFSRFYSRQLGPEQLYNALSLASGEPPEGKSPWERSMKRNEWVRQFARSLGNDDGAEATNFNGTIAQALALMNGQLTERAIRLESGSFLYQLAWDASIKPEDKIDLLFLTALARPADNMERAAADRILLARKGDIGQALQDLYWALLNSNEFMLNH